MIFETPPSVKSKFELVLLAAQRAKQLLRGAEIRVDSDTRKRTFLALEEIVQERVLFHEKESGANEKVPQSVEKES